VLFSFLTRIISSKPQQNDTLKADENTFLHDFVIKEGGKFFPDFKLYHLQNTTSIDMLVFLPNFGIFIGETIDWNASELANATVERSSRRIKRPAATHFESIESKTRRKLEDVLSFDSTPIERFILMKNLTQAEFDSLDPSFHEQLPKHRLLFSDESLESIKAKFYSMAEYRQEPYSALKIIGALNTHTFILPTPANPSGALLSPQQNIFITSEYEGATTLSGGYGSGKSTLLVRKALLYLLSHPHGKVIIMTPTLLGGELLRNELVSLLEYGALTIDLNAVYFHTPPLSGTESIDRLEDLKIFQEASVILCDDAHLFDEEFVQTLEKQRGKRWLLLTTILPHEAESVFELTGRFRRLPTPMTVFSKHNRTIITLLLNLRKTLKHANTVDILIVVDNDKIELLKESVDEYFNLNCRIVSSTFSLQYQNLDSVIITTPQYCAPISRTHVFLVDIDRSDANYPLVLSRASESLTIITCENPIREDEPDENPEN